MLTQHLGAYARWTSAGFDVCGAVADAVSLVRDTHDQRPDVVITDIRMPPALRDDGLWAARQIRRELTDVGVVVLSHPCCAATRSSCSATDRPGWAICSSSG